MIAGLIALAVVVLTWESPDPTNPAYGQARTQVERRLLGFTPYTTIADMAPGEQTYTDDETLGGYRHCYRVLAYLDGERASYSNEVCLDVPPPSCRPRGASGKCR